MQSFSSIVEKLQYVYQRQQIGDYKKGLQLEQLQKVPKFAH